MNKLSSGKRKLSYKGEPLLAHPAGFFVMPRKVVELASAPPTAEGFASCLHSISVYKTAYDSDSEVRLAKSWGQTNYVSECTSEMWVVRSGEKAIDVSLDFPLGKKRLSGFNVQLRNDFEIKMRQDESRALFHDYYRRDEVVTPAQLALESLRQRLDGGQVEKQFRIRYLKEWASEAYYKFCREWQDYGCSCHLSPPCSYCTEEGNPASLEEDDCAWFEAICPESELSLYADPYILMEVLYEQR